MAVHGHWERDAQTPKAHLAGTEYVDLEQYHSRIFKLKMKNPPTKIFMLQ